MKKTFSLLATFALLSGASPTQSNAGDCNYVYGGDKTCCPKTCCDGFSYDFIDVAYQGSDFASAVAPGVLTGAIQTAPNASIVDAMRGVNVAFSKAVGCNFYLAGEYSNIDGPLSPEIVAARQLLVGDQLLTGKRAEFYYYRLGVGYHHSLADNLDVTMEGGGIFWNCEVPGKDQDEWAWYLSPGLRYCLGGLGELYVNYMYENYESFENHRFEGGAIIPVRNCLSLKLAGRYETEHENSSLLAGLRFNY